MSTITQSKLKTGAFIAVSAAVLVMSGFANAADKDSGEAKIHCAGVNSCKGTSECKTTENACKGQNVCKGHGFVNERQGLRGQGRQGRLTNKQA